ncbi:MAG: preprotein translocase subunit YajC [Myxococcota bacterium]|nr:preprotein translocase subunit YajC [Myxococcota bacterium]
MIWLQAQPGSPLDFLVPMAAIFLIFYFLLIRPQQKQQKEHEEMRSSVSRGDKVVTTGGIHGTVTGAEGEVVTLEIANVEGKRIRVKLDRTRIDRRLSDGDEGNKK